MRKRKSKPKKKPKKLPKYETILEQRDKQIAKNLEAFEAGFEKIENNVYASLNKELKKLSIQFGKLSDDAYSKKVLMQLDNVIKNSLEQSGYGNKVYNLIGGFDDISNSNIDVQKELNKKTPSLKLINSVKQIEIQNTIDNLLVSGISRDFTIPIRQVLYRHVTLGTSLLDAEKTIKDLVLGSEGKQSNLIRYSKQVAADTMYQFDGAINQAIKEELGLNGFLYTGSIVEQSRSQCRYWVAKRVLKADKTLAAEIRTAINGGHLGSYKQKCSGMIPGTTLENFSLYRGGNKCRHRATGIIYENFA